MVTWTTTADFDLWTKSGIATVTNILGITADQFQLGLDGVNDTEITPDSIGTNANLIGRYLGTERWCGQTITPASNFYCTAFRWYVKAKAQVTLTSPVIARIYATVGGIPTGAALVSSNSISYAAIAINALNTFTFATPIYLQSGVLYALTIETTQAGGADGDDYTYYRNTTNPYVNGTIIAAAAIAWPPAPWVASATIDLRCNVQSQDLLTAGNGISPSFGSAGKVMTQIDIGTANTTAVYKGDKVEVLKSGVVKATWNDDIITNGNHVLNAANISSGSLTDCNGTNLQVKVYLAGDGGNTCQVTDVTTTMIDIPSGRAHNIHVVGA